MKKLPPLAPPYTGDVYKRQVFNSPGGMYDGTLIQNRDIYNVPSVRRNPVLADVFTQLDYMEKRGSGLKKICELTAQLNGYTEQDVYKRQPPWRFPIRTTRSRLKF